MAEEVKVVVKNEETEKKDSIFRRAGRKIKTVAKKAWDNKKSIGTGIAIGVVGTLLYGASCNKKDQATDECEGEPCFEVTFSTDTDSDCAPTKE